MNIWISVDIEGVAGFSHPRDGMPGGPGWMEARGWMTGEAAAACEAARAAGADKVVVADGHGLGTNLILDKLPAWVEVVSSWPRPLLIAQGAESDTFQGAALIGHHHGARQGGMLAHTVHGGRFTEIRVNGKPATETSLHAAVLGELGVPVILVSGDQAYCDHARELLGDVVTVVTKQGHGYQSGRSVTPARSRELIAAGMAEAVAGIDRFTPLPAEGPHAVEADLVRTVEAELYGYLPGLAHAGGNTVRFVSDTAAEVVRILMFMACMHSEI